MYTQYIGQCCRVQKSASLAGFHARFHTSVDLILFLKVKVNFVHRGPWLEKAPCEIVVADQAVS